MRMSFIVVAGMSVALAGCQHSSDKPPVTTVTPPVVKPDTGTTPPKPDTPSTIAALFGLKGLGLNGTTAVNLSGQLKTPNTGSSSITGKYAPVSLSYTGDQTLKGSLFTTGRDDRGEDGDIRFLMSDQSINSKDAPTAFGLLVDKSSATQFAASALYGGKAPTDIPGSGTASYAGKFTGQANAGAGDSGAQAAVSGNFNLAADFGAGTVKGKVDALKTAQLNPDKPVGKGIDDITFNGTLNADRVSYTATDVKATGLNNASGKAEGGFYNGGASETAGALTVGDGTTNIVGAFYGGKQP